MINDKNMKKAIIILGFILCTVNIYSQIVSVSNGIAISKIQSSIGYENPIYTYSISLSLNYLNAKYYEVSSRIGWYNKGGNTDIQLVDCNGDIIANNISNTMGYLQLGTNFRGKLPLGKFALFAGCGPKIDILLKTKSNISTNYISPNTDLDLTKRTLKSAVFGINPEIGIMYETDQLRFEISSSYICDLHHIDKNDLNIKGNSLLLLFSIGLIL